MADKIIDLLTACFWDLRSQCESQMRTLSSAQDLLAEVRHAGGRTYREPIVRKLRDQVKGLASTHAAIEGVIADVHRHIDPHGRRVIAKTDGEVMAAERARFRPATFDCSSAGQSRLAAGRGLGEE